MLDEKPDLHDKQRQILQALLEVDGRANTSELRKRLGFSSSLIHYHLSRLEGEFVEVVGTEDVGRPSPANLYELTEDGRVLAESFDEPLQPAERDAQIKELRDRVAHLTDELEAVREEARAARDERDELAAEVEELREVNRGLVEEVETVSGVVTELIDRLENHDVIAEDSVGDEGGE